MPTRTLTDTATIAWTESPAGVLTADVVNGSITPAKLSQTYLTAASADALFLTLAEGNAAYQPLDADLTSWAAVTRASGFDTFVATPSSANLRGLLTDETGTGTAVFATSPGFTTAANPVSNDGAALGTAALMWSDLFLATGGVINWSNGDISIAHSADRLSLAFDGTAGIILNKTQTELVNVFQESGETTFAAGHIFRASDAGSHNAVQHNFVHIESRPLGSGTNGPASADSGLSISIVKQNFDDGLTAVTGEIDGLTIAVRQGGTASDACGILVNAGHTGAGFTGILESVTNLTPAPTFVATKSIRCQIGVIDNVGSASFGYYVSADVGAVGEAFRADNVASAGFTHFFRGMLTGVDVFTVSGLGVIHTYRNDTETVASQLSIEQDGTGDAIMDFLLTGANIWQLGVDNSDGDAFKISPSQDSFASAVFSLSTAGQIRVAAGTLAANAAVATVLGSVGPTGAATTVQQWLRIVNAGGTNRYIPMF